MACARNWGDGLLGDCGAGGPPTGNLSLAGDPFGILGPAAQSLLDAALAPVEAAALAATGGAVGAAAQSLLAAPPAETALRPEKSAQRLAGPGDSCPECLCALQVTGLMYECPACHAVFEAADIQDVLPASNPEIPGAAALRGRLRIVGVEAGWYQPDMDSTNPGESSDNLKKATYSELQRLNAAYENRGGNPFPVNVLQEVAEKYYVIQQTSVKRSVVKRGIIAALVYHTCIAHNFTRSNKEVAEFAGLPNHGIARGDDYIRSIAEDKDLNINMNEDRLHPHIVTAFAQLGLDDEAHDRHRAAVAAVVRAANDKHIGFQSVLRSKVLAATAEVLRRGASEITSADVAKKCRIRLHTINRFLENLARHHTHFEGIYRAYELDPSPVEGAAN